VYAFGKESYYPIFFIMFLYSRQNDFANQTKINGRREKKA